MIVLAKNFAPFFKEQPERLSKPAVFDTLVFLKIIKMVFSEAVARWKESLWKLKINQIPYVIF